MFDAINIERAFSSFFGGSQRDLLDAAVFRGGDPKNLGEIVESFAKRLRKRSGFWSSCRTKRGTVERSPGWKAPSARWSRRG